jgi:hypothetical protein
LVPSTPGSASIASGDALEQALAGATLVTAGRRLARALRERVSRLQRARDRQAWAAPAILPWSAWIENLWQELLFSERSGQLPIALDEHQEQLVWELAIESSPESDALLQVASTAAEAAQAWRLIHAWRLDLGAFTAHATADIRAFAARTGSTKPAPATTSQPGSPTSACLRRSSWPASTSSPSSSSSSWMPAAPWAR